MKVSDDALPKFVLASIQDPIGFKPGLYHYVLYLPNMHKVSRYHRKIGSIHRKIERYNAMYGIGDRHWPEVTREDELRDNPDAVLTIREKFRVALWGHE